MKQIFVAFLFLSIMFGCKKEEITPANTENYLVFGHFFGFCFGEKCIEIFKVSDIEVSEDSLDKYPQRDTFYKGNFKTLSNDKFLAVKDISNTFPTALLSEKDTVIGMPDAGDWGGFYIEYKKDGVHKFWILDKLKTNVPEKYHAFMKQMEDKITILQK